LLNLIVTILGGYIGLYAVAGEVAVLDSFTWVLAISMMIS